MFSGYQDTSMFMHLTVLFWEVNNLCSLQSVVVVLVWEGYLFTALVCSHKGLDARKPVLTGLRKTKVQTSLHIRAV